MQTLRYAAFTDRGTGGNPAGVVLDASALDAGEMLAIAADLGYSESAFVLPAPPSDGVRRATVRYFSPVHEVDFCGHATIATAVALADRDGPGEYVFTTKAGDVAVVTHRDESGTSATLTSVEPATLPISDAQLADTLTALRWHPADLDPALPPRIAFAGASHAIIAASTRGRLADLDYDVPALEALLVQHGWTTVALVFRSGPATFDARNAFPFGGIVEDPATGAAAAALGGYLRDLGLVDPPIDITIRQGTEVGRPSVLHVHIPPRGGIAVSGHAIALPG